MAINDWKPPAMLNGEIVPFAEAALRVARAQYIGDDQPESPDLRADEAERLRAETRRADEAERKLRFLADIARSLGWTNRKQESNAELIGRALREGAEAMKKG